MAMETTQFEVKKVAKIIESKEVDDLVECFKTLELRAVPIGEGQNGIVYAAEGTPYEKVCLKKAKQKPHIVCNTIEEEHKYQAMARKAGVATPLTLISLETDDGAYFVMERVNGITVDELSLKPNLKPAGFDYDTFCKSLDDNISKLHDAGIYHRDLHMQNIMVDENGLSVIIDYGTATTGTGGELTYDAAVQMYNPVLRRYEASNKYFKEDDEQVRKAKAILRQYKNFDK